MRWLSCVATIAAIVLAPAFAAAQDGATPDPAAATVSSSRDEARTEFEAGLRAAGEGDWATAHDRFARARELAPLPSVLMNLAGAQRQTGRLLAAASSYRQWLAEATSERDAAHRPSVEEALARVDAAIPRLIVVANDLAPGDEVQIDGTSTMAEREIQLDPGPHTVAVLRGGSAIARRSVHLREGERERVELDVSPASVVSPALGEEDRERRIEDAIPTGTERPGEDLTAFIVLGTGIGVAVIAGVIVGVVLATGVQQPYAGNVPPGTWDVH